MAQQNSFDIVSQVDISEVKNALDQTMKEVRQRFDFKGSRAEVRLEEGELILAAEDETKLRNMNDISSRNSFGGAVPSRPPPSVPAKPPAAARVAQHAPSQQASPRAKPKKIS